MAATILLLSLITGLSFIIGLFLSKKIKAKWLSYFSTSLAFMVLVAVLTTDIIPRIITISDNYPSIWLTICGEVLGIFLLVIIDLFIPNHHHDHKHNDDSKKDHKEHLYHIGLLTFVSVIFHNILEGVAFYIVGKTSIKSALFISGAIILHNIPLSIEISTFFDKSKKNNLMKQILLVLSGSLGVIIGICFSSIGQITSIISLSILCGMMLYLVFFELGIETFNERKEKGIIEGLLIGGIIFALLLL